MPRRQSLVATAASDAVPASVALGPRSFTSLLNEVNFLSFANPFINRSTIWATNSLAKLDRPYDTVQAKHGRIDVLYANAGGGDMLPLGGLTEAHVGQTFDRNVKGVVFTVQQALPLLDKAVNGASVILAGSTTGITGTANSSIYSASKVAVCNLTRGWVLDLTRSLDSRQHAVAPADPHAGPGRIRRAGSHAATGSARLHDLAGPDRAHRATGGCRRGCGLPRLRRLVVHHRHRVVRRRWHRAGLIDALTTVSKQQ